MNRVIVNALYKHDRYISRFSFTCGAYVVRMVGHDLPVAA